MVARRLLPALLAGVLACAPTPSPRPGDHHGSDADLAITRLGHAGLLVTLGSTHLLVDPWFHDRLLVRQREPIGVQPSGLPAVRAVLLTDDEATRADPDALAELAPSVPLAVGPPRLRRRLAALGFRQIVTLEHWQQAAIDGVRLTAVPGRGNGYLLQAGPSTVYVAGEDADAAVATEVARAAGGIDVALVPIGGRRRLGMATGTSPEAAAAAAAQLGARRIIPCAYGAAGFFPLLTFARDPVERFRRAAQAAGIAPEAVVVLEPGESWHYFR